jgi:hypothetical protein
MASSAALIRQVPYHGILSSQWLLLRPKRWCCHGSPHHAPEIANFYMKFFEWQAISQAAKKLAHWYRYRDDTFVVWTHGKEELQGFLRHLNNIHSNIKFTMEVEQNTLSKTSLWTEETAHWDTLFLGNPRIRTCTFMRSLNTICYGSRLRWKCSFIGQGLYGMLTA